MAQITTKTVDRLHDLAVRLSAMREAVHEAGFVEEARAIGDAGYILANTAVSLDGKIEAGVRQMLKDG